MDNLLITCGCDEAIRLTFEASLSSSDTFLTIAPTYRGSITNAADLCNNIIECADYAINDYIKQKYNKRFIFKIFNS